MPDFWDKILYKGGQPLAFDAAIRKNIDMNDLSKPVIYDYWSNLLQNAPSEEKAFVLKNIKTVKDALAAKHALDLAKTIAPQIDMRAQANMEHWPIDSRYKDYNVRTSMRKVAKRELAKLAKNKDMEAFVHWVGKEPWKGNFDLNYVGSGQGAKMWGTGIYAAKGWVPYMGSTQPYFLYKEGQPSAVQAKIIQVPKKAIVEHPAVTALKGGKTMAGGLGQYTQLAPDDKALLHHDIWGSLPGEKREPYVLIRDPKIIKHVKDIEMKWEPNIKPAYPRVIKETAQKRLDYLEKELLKAHEGFKYTPELTVTGKVLKAIGPKAIDAPLTILNLLAENQGRQIPDYTPEFAKAVEKGKQAGAKKGTSVLQEIDEAIRRAQVANPATPVMTSEAYRETQPALNIRTQSLTNPINGMYVAPQSSTYVQPLPYAR